MFSSLLCLHHTVLSHFLCIAKPSRARPWQSINPRPPHIAQWAWHGVLRDRPTLCHNFHGNGEKNFARGATNELMLAAVHIATPFAPFSFHFIPFDGIERRRSNIPEPHLCNVVRFMLLVFVEVMVHRHQHEGVFLRSPPFRSVSSLREVVLPVGNECAAQRITSHHSASHRRGIHRT